MPIFETLKNKPASERAKLKGQEIARQVRHIPRAQGKRQNYDIEIVETKPIEKGVEVYARAWHKNGEQIGFGKDGTVDIERFVIINPPVLVPDSNGDIDRSYNDRYTGEFVERKYREDVREAILQVLEHNLSVMKNKHSSEKIVAEKRGNTTTTVYPDADTESTTVDGSIGSLSSTSWDTVHDFTSQTNGSTRDSANPEDTTSGQNSGGDHVIRRGFTFFDTSSISGTDTIDSATYSLWFTSITNNENDGNDFLTVVQAQGQNIGSDTALADDDYDQAGDAIDDPTEGIDAGTRPDATGVTTGQYTDMALNATGLGWIARSGEASPSGATNGITYLATRTGHDVLDEPHGGTPDNRNIWIWSSADNAGTSQDPKLVVEHSAAAAAAGVVPQLLTLGAG